MKNLSTDLSIAKEVMPAKREMKKSPSKVGGEIQALDVDNFSNPTENVEYRNLAGKGRI